MTTMILPLDIEVLIKHKQLFPNSCVTMGVEFVLKLMKAIPADSFDLQNKYGDQQKSGDDFNGMTINNVLMKKELDHPRGPGFPLNDLFEKIKFEIDNGRYVNCAWRPDPNSLYHAFIIYGYNDDEFLAVTKYYNNTSTKKIDDMKTKLKHIQGSDLITFTKN